MTRLFIVILILLAWIVLLLPACSVMQPNSKPSDHALAKPSSWAEQQQQAQALSQWRIRGKVALKLINDPAQSTKPQAFSANVYWQQIDRTHYAIDLFGPIGLGAVKLTGTPGQIVLTDHNNQQYTASSPEALMQQQLGWHLPITALYYWVRAIPDPSLPIDAQQLNAQHLLINLTQGEWQISYSDYQPVLFNNTGNQSQQNLWLAHKIHLTNPRLRIILIINHIS